MKLTGIILLTGFLQVSARGTAQTVTYAAKAAPLTQVLAVIEHQTGYSVFYNDADLQGALPVTVQLRTAPLLQALEKVLAGQPVVFDIQGTTIYLIRKSKTAELPQPLEPPGDIHGRVTDSLGNPLGGASVVVKGKKKGTVTDPNGNFTLKALEQNVVLVISFTGYASKEMNIGDQNEIRISLARSNSQLDQVQVIPYGTTTRRLNTGDVTTVTSKEIGQQPVTNVLSALEGRVPGLVITQVTGVPGGAFTVQIRGQNSIANGNDPFFVIDGVPYNSSIPTQPLESGSGILLNGTLRGGSPLNYINPNDIESVEVLKDADATAIYGSRAANGAILITTKKGKAGALKLDLNLSSGFTKPARDIPLLNTQQYLAMRHEAFNNDAEIPQSYDYDVNGVWDTTRYTNWSNVLTRHSGQYLNSQASLSGGNINTQYLVSGSFNRQTTGFPRLLPGDGANESGSVHFNINTSSADKKFKMDLTGSYLSNSNTAQSEDFSTDRIALAPDAPAIFNADGSLNWAPIVPGQGGTWTNPYALLNEKYKQNAANLITNTGLSYTLLPNLELKTNFGYTITQTNEVLTFPTTATDPAEHVTSGRAYFNSTNSHSWIIEPQANYRLRLGSGQLTALIGGTFQENNGAAEKINSSGFVSDALLENVQAATNISIASNSSQYKYNAIFGRLNYDWEDKYLLNMVGRRDGSSRFGPGRRIGSFGAVGAAWIFSKEKFIQNNLPFLSFGKLRASYGTTGNDGIADYQYLDLYTPTYNPYGGQQGLIPTNLFNAELAWEVNKKLEGGIELGVLKDHITFQISFYRNRSGNQLVNSAVSEVTGFSSIPYNLPALVENSGKELVVNTINIKSHSFTWTSSFNLTIPRNKLLAFPDIAHSGYSYLQIGKPLSALPLYHMSGINDTTGMYQFTDSKGNLTYNPDYRTDRTILLSQMPQFYGGLQNSFSYKGLTLDFLFEFKKQIGQNMFGAWPGMSGIMSNIPVAFLNRWQKPGDHARYQKFSQDYSTPVANSMSYAQESDFAYSDASFIRLKNMAISWQFPKAALQKLHLQNCRIYIQGQNLLTISHYEGIDPESQGTNIAPMRVWTGGFQINL